MIHKIKIIDILLVVLLFITIDDFKQGYILAGLINTIIIICNIEIRIKQIRR